MNAPFAQEKQVLVDLPLWKQPEVQDLARSFAWPIGTLLFGALVLLGVIRPAIKALSKATPHVTMPTPQLDALESDEPERPLLAAPVAKAQMPLPTSSELALTNARKLTLDNPAAVANIMKTWINGEPAA
jgi:flagellar M-ring protein FliF